MPDGGAGEEHDDEERAERRPREDERVAGEEGAAETGDGRGSGRRGRFAQFGWLRDEIAGAAGLLAHYTRRGVANHQLSDQNLRIRLANPVLGVRDMGVVPRDRRLDVASLQDTRSDRGVTGSGWRGPHRGQRCACDQSRQARA